VDAHSSTQDRPVAMTTRRTSTLVPDLRQQGTRR
jgi:hypothetical protein